MSTLIDYLYEVRSFEGRPRGRATGSAAATNTNRRIDAPPANHGPVMIWYWLMGMSLVLGGVAGLLLGETLSIAQLRGVCEQALLRCSGARGAPNGRRLVVLGPVSHFVRPARLLAGGLPDGLLTVLNYPDALEQRRHSAVHAESSVERAWPTDDRTARGSPRYGRSLTGAT